MGILVGFVLIQPTDFSDFQTHLALLMDEFEISIPEFSPLEFPLMNFSRVEMEWQRLWKNILEPWKLNKNGLEFTVGEKIAAKGLSAKHPVVLVPGIISTVCRSDTIRSESKPYMIMLPHRVWSLGLPLLNTDHSFVRNYGAVSR